MSNSYLNVVICTHNRVLLLVNTINSILSADKPASFKLRLVIVANACNDQTISELDKIKHNLANDDNVVFDIVIEPRPGKSYALNTAISLIDDGFICLIDDDQVIMSNYFNAVVDSITRYPETSIFCGPIYPDWKGDEPAWIHSEQHKIYPPPIPTYDLGNRPILMPDESSELPGGGHTIVHRKVFQNIGNFSTSFGPKGHDLLGSEDTDFFRRAIDAGFKIQYVPDIKQLHFVDKSRLRLRYLVLKSFQRNRSISKAAHYNDRLIPLYLIKMLAINLCNTFVAALTFRANKLRFHIMRLFSTLGEIAGRLKI